MVWFFNRGHFLFAFSKYTGFNSRLLRRKTNKQNIGGTKMSIVRLLKEGYVPCMFCTERPAKDKAFCSDCLDYIKERKEEELR